MSTATKFLNGLEVVSRVIGGIAGVFLGLLGVFIIFRSKSGLESKSVLLKAISGFYCIVFFVLIIVAELRLKFVMKYFLFLNTFLGKGIFYLFAGILAFPIELSDYSWIIDTVGFVLVAVGILNIVLMFLNCCRKSQPAANTSSPAPSSPEEEVQPILSSKSSV